VPHTVKIRYNGLGYNGYSVNTDFFLDPDEYLLISMCDNTVRMDSVTTDFSLLQTAFQFQHYERAGYNRLIEIMTTASLLM